MNLYQNSVYDNLQIIKVAMKTRRVAVEMTQEAVSEKTGISLGTLKRFEQTGEISLERLLTLMQLYEMDSRIVPHFQEMGWWTLKQIERADTRQKG